MRATHRIVALVLLWLAAGAAGDLLNLDPSSFQLLFTRWVHQHGKQYEIGEFFHRFEIWKDNLNKITRFNLFSNATYILAMNQLGDLTSEEFKSKYLGFKNNGNEEQPNSAYHHTDNNGGKENGRHIYSKHEGIIKDGHMLDSVPPSSKDWRDNNMVTRVKNQESCGGCWSFSSTGALESAYAISSGRLVEFSVQELIDCSTPYGNQGCNGGLMDPSFQYIIDHGLCAESDYPYTASDDICKNNSYSKLINAGELKGYTHLPRDESALLGAVAQQPVSIAIQASSFSFQFYKSGVYQDILCGTQVDHAVLIVGYGSQQGLLFNTNYWIVKNSWGTQWGEEGYIRLVRNRNQCGLTSYATYPHF